MMDPLMVDMKAASLVDMKVDEKGDKKAVAKAELKVEWRELMMVGPKALLLVNLME